MALNMLAGRSYSDITQYPVMPWVVADYVSQTVDFTPAGGASASSADDNGAKVSRRRDDESAAAAVLESLDRVVGPTESSSSSHHRVVVSSSQFIVEPFHRGPHRGRRRSSRARCATQSRTDLRIIERGSVGRAPRPAAPRVRRDDVVHTDLVF